MTKPTYEELEQKLYETQQQLSIAEDLLSDASNLLDNVHCYDTPVANAIDKYFHGDEDEEFEEDEDEE